VILEYRRPVFKRRDAERLITRAPANLLECSVADISFLIDRFLYPQPVHRCTGSTGVCCRAGSR
jgi:hypothetical protein